MDNQFELLTDYALSQHNTLRVPVQAKTFVEVTHVGQLQRLINSATWQEAPRFILGEGSNTLFTQDFPGVVLHNAIKGLEVLDQNDHEVLLRIGAGEHWHDVVEYAIANDYYGVENLALIPGTMGAAPIQNIGAYGVELADVFVSLEAVDATNGEQVEFDCEQCQFGYRDSVFKQTLKNKCVITHVVLRLSKAPVFKLHYYALAERLGEVDPAQLSVRLVADTVISIRQSKLPDPAEIPNAGSFFKNPRVEAAQFAQLQRQYADIPQFPADEGQVKIPAAWLIERCGWKGKRQGRVGVHDQQALVLINPGQGVGSEVMALAHAIQADVQQQFGITLEAEVTVV